MCEYCNKSREKGISEGIVLGAEIGIKHLDYLDTYYQGMNQRYVEYDEMSKAISISPTGILNKVGEEPIDEYIAQLIAELRSGLRTGNQKEHIANILKQFSDRKFEDKSWWGYLTEADIDEIINGVRSYWIPHTAMLNNGLAEAYMFGKITKQLTENNSLSEARKKIKNLSLTRYDQARIETIQKTAGLFWDKAIQRETDATAIKLLSRNRDVTTELLKNPDRKSWRSLTSDIYHAINKDNAVVLRDLDRIVLTETAHAQNYAVLSSGKDQGYKYFFVKVRPTACKWCKEMYLDKDGRPKRFLIEEFIDQPRDINWGNKAKEYVTQPPPLHSFCACRLYVE